MVSPDPMLFNARKQIAQLALNHKIPTLVFNSEMVRDGGLMNYGPNSGAIFRRSAAYVDKILKGAKPDELPVELPTTFEFDINLKTAKAIGLTISPAILNLADEVIE